MNKLIGRDLKELSLGTVKMFNTDIKSLGYSIYRICKKNVEINILRV